MADHTVNEPMTEQTPDDRTLDDDRHMDDRFGEPVGTFGGMSRWFKGEPNIVQEPMRQVQSRWMCPQDDCDGEMWFSGHTWPANGIGYHHTCRKCKFTAAISGKKYPAIEYLPPLALGPAVPPLTNLREEVVRVRTLLSEILMQVILPLQDYDKAVRSSIGQGVATGSAVHAALALRSRIEVVLDSLALHLAQEPVTAAAEWQAGWRELVDFAKTVIQNAWEGTLIDGGTVQELAMDLGLILKTAFDPAQHGPADADPGDDWFVFAPVLADKALRTRPAVAERHAGWRDVLDERKRQIKVEGWSIEHDDEHINGEMAVAAGMYAIHSANPDILDVDYHNGDIAYPAGWPWHRQWWKPTNRRRDLVKAGALILAEIERLDRLAAAPAPQAAAVGAEACPRCLGAGWVWGFDGPPLTCRNCEGTGSLSPEQPAKEVWALSLEEHQRAWARIAAAHADLIEKHHTGRLSPEPAEHKNQSSETVPVQESGQRTAEEGGLSDDRTLPLGQAPTNSSEPAAPASEEMVERVADAIDAARYAHPDNPRERDRPFSEADRSNREYATRLARAALAAAKPGVEAATIERCIETGRKVVDQYETRGSLDRAIGAADVVNAISALLPSQQPGEEGAHG